VLRGDRSDLAVGRIVVSQIELAEDGVPVDRVPVGGALWHEDEDALAGVEVAFHVDGFDEMTVLIHLHGDHGLDSNTRCKVFIFVVGGDCNDGHMWRVCEAICPGCDASQ